VPRSVSSIGSLPRKKWLNIVFDLNGILCQCIDRSQIPKSARVNHVGMHLFSSSHPTVVGPKAVYTRPRLAEFLAMVAEVADHVFVWSSMRRSTVELIAGFLFYGAKQPYEIMGQDFCTKVQIAEGQHLKDLSGTKEIFFKDLSKRVFSISNGAVIDKDNTLIIDDSPEKSVCNEAENAIFLESWSRSKRRDDFLMGSLAPWLRQLHSSCAPGRLRVYVEDNRIGRGPLQPSDPLYAHIRRGLNQSLAFSGQFYDFPGIR
jgi:hypothetical protein